MRKLFQIFSALLVVVTFYACNRSVVSLDYTNAKGEVERLQNLVFRFSKALVNDSMVNKWDSTQFITFEPAIAGKFRWEHPDELVFSPSKPLPPATSFKAKLKDELLQYSEFGKVSSKEDVEFKTPDLKLDEAHVTWVLQDETSRKAVPQLDLYFNYPVNPAALKDKLELELEGSKVDYAVYTLTGDSKVSLRLNSVAPRDKDLEALITLDKGLVPEGGKNGTKEELSSKVYIPSPYNLVINDVTSQHDGIAGTVRVKTSQRILMSSLTSLVTVSPNAKLKLEETEDGFLIASEDFDASKSYLLTLAKGMRGVLGGVLREQYDNNIAFGELEPTIRFANSKAVYLSSKGNEQIEISIVNVPKVKVIISKIYESNLLASMRYGYYPTDRRQYDDEEYDSDYSSDRDLAIGDVVYEAEIETRTLPKYGNSRLFRFNVEDRLADFKGIYHIKIRSATDYWVTDSRFISKTDIGMIAKEGKEKMIVFTNSIRTAEALNGVSLIVYGSNNQVLGTGTTDANGAAEIDYSRKEFSGFRPAMIIAKTNDDFNYLPFSNTVVNTSRFEVGGKKFNSTGLDAFIYEERDIYRPGETINYSVIIRDRQWKSPGELPVKLKFLLPNGKELSSSRKTLNEAGSIAGSLNVSTSAITGSYTLEVYSSNDILLASKNYNVEEFVPDRIKVSAKTDKTILRPGQSANLAISAVNFFGPPAAGRNYEAEIQVRPKRINPSKYSSYSFELSNSGLSFDKVVKEGVTDGEGNATELYSVPDVFKNVGMLQATFYATVFDETGRPVSRSTSADIITQDVFFGIGSDGYWYYPLNQQVKFPLIGVNKDQQAVNGAKAEVKIIKHEYRTVLSKAGSYFRYESQQDDKIVSEQVITVSGENTLYNFVPRSPGNYEIRVSVPGAPNYVSKQFYSYGYWGGDNNSFEVNTEGNIDIELDKSSYNAGESARLLFKTPFSGRMLVTVETDKVLSHQYINVEKRSASMDLKFATEHLPNVYVTATLIKPHQLSDIPLTVAHGFQRIRVEEKSRRMAVQVTAAKSTRSNTQQKIRVKADPGSYVTLAAVDNGVLQISGYKTPDPYSHFYAPRALEVSAYDMYPLFFPEVQARLSSSGGDGDMEMSKRVNPMPAKRIKVVSYWSGIKTAGSDGEAEFDVQIPAFSGEVRLMAIAYRDNSFGSSEANMTVADPLVLSTALPRFLSPADTIDVPVTITNTTAKSGTATASLVVKGPMKVVGSSSMQVSVMPNSEQRANFRITAASSIGTGSVKIEVAGLGEKFVSETEMGVRPAAPLQVQTGSGSLTASTSTLEIPLNDFMTGTSNYTVVVGRSPVLDIGPQLKYLVQYPYGCTEQTISAAFPQLYFDDLASLTGDKSASNRGAASNVQEAIRKIKMRQLYNGAVTLWDGEGSEHWWTTIYAAHFLLEAKRAGFDVENNLLNGLLSYINNRLKTRETIIYYYNRDQNKKIAPKEVAYSLYVLSLAAQPNVPAMNYYKANPALLSLDSKYLLSVSYAVSGDRNRFKEFLPASFSGEVSVPQTGGSFYSDIRDEAIALNALIDADPANAQIPVMAKHVADKLKQRSWYNTQESSFGFLALGKLAKAAANSNVTAEIRVNGKPVANVSQAAVSLDAKKLGGNKVEIITKGQGRMYYFWQSEGISRSGTYKEEDSYLKVRKKFFDRKGSLINGTSFRQNDLVIVQVTLEKNYTGSVQNIVITDLLPAGFELENPRTKEIPGMDWIKDANTPVSLDVRDDRINLFVDLNSNKQVYYYAVRAVSPGIFRMGPVSAEAMYNQEYHSYHGGGYVRVEGK